MRLKTDLTVFEPLLIYAVLFFPSVFLFMENSSFILTSASSVTVYLITAIPQIIFIIWILDTKNYSKTEAGMTKIKSSTIPLAIFYTAALLLFSTAFTGLYSRFFYPDRVISSVTAANEAAAAVRDNFSLLPLYLVVSAVTGYREELFFRSYLLNALKNNGRYYIPVILSSLMFSACHAYQGTAGILLSFSGGIVLSLIFLKHRNIHINALSHTFFNFFVILSYVFSF